MQHATQIAIPLQVDFMLADFIGVNQKIPYGTCHATFPKKDK